MRNNTRQITLLSAMLAMSLVLAVAESMLSALIPVPIPGVKLGLANIVTMFILCYFSLPAALAVGMLRALLSSLFSGGIGLFIYAAPGALLSVLIMYLAITGIKRLSIAGISILGACTHNVMQVCVAVLVTGEVNLFYYAFVLMIVGAVSGTITGLVAAVTFPKASRALNITARHNTKYLFDGGL